MKKAELESLLLLCKSDIERKETKIKNQAKSLHELQKSLSDIKGRIKHKEEERLKVNEKSIKLQNRLLQLQQENEKLNLQLERMLVEGCGKTSYSTSIEAEMALSKIHNNRNAREKTPVRKYKCNLCGEYHLTSKKLRK